MERALAGKIAIVTGASRGIGRAVAADLAGRGADVVVTARTSTPRDDIGGSLDETLESIVASGGSAVAVPADLLLPADRDRLVGAVLDRFGHVDILVNNAAYIGNAVFESVWEMNPESWRNMIELNVNVPWALTKAVAPAMRTQGGGLIVNLASGASRRPEPGAVMSLPGAGGLGAAYPTSKAALNQLTFYVGNELRAAGIAMVAVDPGFTSSESAEILAGRLGLSLDGARPAEAVAKAIGHIATSDPMGFAGLLVLARELVDEDGLLKA